MDINDKSKAMIKQLNKISDKESLEYIYMDDIKDSIINLEEVFNDSFLITRNNDDELVMVDNNADADEKTILSFIPEVDLMIIDNRIQLPTPLLEEMICEHTIILKIFNKIYYIEDQLKNEVYITSENESLKILNKGIYTNIIRENTQRL